ncbi:MAG: tRNA (N6-isopentenyl adenosine(37)-C2)-methylthiotransferase MiaB [Bacteroidales bacterium]|nr:tRNA (N6-isopentenyl adenosine(37)-C2)-methylthiotransferase MiaB [Bacteroidales bacterium]
MGDKKLFIETYGCQMNFSDSEIVASILKNDGFEIIDNKDDATVILINTCSIRDHAEQRIRRRLSELKSLKKRNPDLQIGLIGCMAERMKEEVFEKHPEVDIVAGPDSYRSLPELIAQAAMGQAAANTILSEEETYAEIQPVRLHSNGISAFISIMRGCQNFCSYCVVPYTRGKERSRSPQTIVNEAKELFEKGYYEVTLLGQNVNSYQWEEAGKIVRFPDLITMVGDIHPDLRVRFTTSHPKDLSDDLIRAIAGHENICNAIHLAVQSGNDRILHKMNRKYTRAYYLERVAAIRKQIPDCGISTDIIVGFCSETEDEFQDTLSLVREVGFDSAFMFKYSERPNTMAQRQFEDDVPEEEKLRRLDLLVQLQQEMSLESNRRDIGKIVRVLIEGTSKKNKKMLMGRDGRNKVVVFQTVDTSLKGYVDVTINDCTSATLIGTLL